MRLRPALVNGAITSSFLLLSHTMVLAGCNSGNVANSASIVSSTCQANASGSNATAIGSSAIAAVSGAIAIGHNSVTAGDDATGVGGGSRAQGVASAAFGNSSWAGGLLSVAVGATAGLHLSNAAAGYVVIGGAAGRNQLLGHYSTTIGSGVNSAEITPHANGAYAIAIGGGDGASGNNGARAKSDHAIAIGTSSVAQGLRSVAVGTFAGYNAAAGNQTNAAFGYSAGRSISGSYNLAAGGVAGSTVNGSYNVALGYSAGGAVTGSQNIALGRSAGSSVAASNTTSIGHRAHANVTGAIAIGSDAVASASNAVAIGTNSVGSASNTVSVGSASIKRRIVNVAPGVSANDAVTVSQLQAAVASARASTPVAARSAVNDDLRREVAELRALVKQLQQEIAKRAVVSAAQ